MITIPGRRKRNGRLVTKSFDPPIAYQLTSQKVMEDIRLQTEKTFYRYSRGSFEEKKGWLRKASRRNIISQERMQEYQLIVDVLGPKLNAFINSTNKNYGN